jgi:hypothetical protein
MPNHCTNELRLVGPKEELDRFRLDATQPVEPWTPKEDDAEPSLLNFQGVVPYPNEGRDDNQGWYKWHTDNWGTKWNAYDVDINVTDQGVSYNFTTAWSPPLPWFKAAALKYPEIKFMMAFFEGGCDFCGVIIQKGSKVILNHESEAWDSTEMVDDSDWFDQQETNFWDQADAFAETEGMTFRPAPLPPGTHPF